MIRVVLGLRIKQHVNTQYSKIRYGIAAYLIPIFEREDVKMEKLSPHAKELQVVQNSIVRVILGLNRATLITLLRVPFLCHFGSTSFVLPIRPLNRVI